MGLADCPARGARLDGQLHLRRRRADRGRRVATASAPTPTTTWAATSSPTSCARGDAGVYDLKRNDVPGSTDRDRVLLARRGNDRLVLRRAPGPHLGAADLQPLQPRVADLQPAAQLAARRSSCATARGRSATRSTRSSRSARVLSGAHLERSVARAVDDSSESGATVIGLGALRPRAHRAGRRACSGRSSTRTSSSRTARRSASTASATSAAASPSPRPASPSSARACASTPEPRDDRGRRLHAHGPLPRRARRRLDPHPRTRSSSCSPTRPARGAEVAAVTEARDARRARLRGEPARARRDARGRAGVGVRARLAPHRADARACRELIAAVHDARRTRRRRLRRIPRDPRPGRPSARPRRAGAPTGSRSRTACSPAASTARSSMPRPRRPTLREWAADARRRRSRSTIAIGDGANDLPHDGDRGPRRRLRREAARARAGGRGHRRARPARRCSPAALGLARPSIVGLSGPSRGRRRRG